MSRRIWKTTAEAPCELPSHFEAQIALAVEYANCLGKKGVHIEKCVVKQGPYGDKPHSLTIEFHKGKDGVQTLTMLGH